MKSEKGCRPRKEEGSTEHGIELLSSQEGMDRSFLGSNGGRGGGTRAEKYFPAIQLLI